jgi:hypothetical protein
MLTQNENEIQLQDKIITLNKDNRELKQKLTTLIDKEKYLQSTLSHIQQIHLEYETLYNTNIANLRTRENTLKNQYQLYQTILEEQYNQNEKRLNDEILQLKDIIKSKDEMISQLSKLNAEIKQTVSKNEITWKYKEQEYEKNLQLKNIQLEEKKTMMEKLLNEYSEKVAAIDGQFRDEPQDNNVNENIQNEQVEITEESHDDTYVGNEGLVDGENKEESLLEDRIKPYKQ